MGKTIFSEVNPATIVTAASMNALNNHRHDGLDQDGSSALDYAVTTGSSNAYILTLPTALTSYVAGLPIYFKASFTNTGSATINISGKGALTIKKNYNQDLIAGDIQSGQIVMGFYDGTYFQVFLQKNMFLYSTDSGSANAYAATYSPALTAHVIGMPLRFKAANANTGASTFNPGPGAVTIVRKDGSTLQAGDIPAGAMIEVVYDGTYYQLQNNVPSVVVLRGYIDGLTMSTAGSSSTMSIAAGQAADSTNADLMALTSSINKTTSAWAVGSGNGGLDTGSIASSTWYHFFLIKRTDTGVVDVLISLSATAPTLPANYSLSRRIGSCKTDSSSKWVVFKQDGDYFRLKASVLDVDNTNPGTSANTGTLASVPSGIRVKALINAAFQNNGNNTLFVSPLDENDEAPVATNAGSASAPMFSVGAQGAATTWEATQMEVMTNTSAQIRYRESASGTKVAIATLGWTDYRGKNA